MVLVEEVSAEIAGQSHSSIVLTTLALQQLLTDLLPCDCM